MNFFIWTHRVFFSKSVFAAMLVVRDVHANIKSFTSRKSKVLFIFLLSAATTHNLYLGSPMKSAAANYTLLCISDRVVHEVQGRSFTCQCAKNESFQVLSGSEDKITCTLCLICCRFVIGPCAVSQLLWKLKWTAFGALISNILCLFISVSLLDRLIFQPYLLISFL